MAGFVPELLPLDGEGFEARCGHYPRSSGPVLALEATVGWAGLVEKGWTISTIFDPQTGATRSLHGVRSAPASPSRSR